ncbi:alpha-beta hydrolase superfamily lysophospholipase [Alicyclobacillus sacchari]|uniref:Alpha-beta hydrolase superfamily lysophospholipase n=1 Tax=Alicyclobacillus sacchari TaxID=392010 RepID=A0A4R8LN45_9BACL|nr:alpha/beta hydrolase [Alicyclobacillus sacchari]TDY45219.1 alpha-beta hydrolase superfamily lysophospholipase [Alicyclobacillus sacchari]GMA56820.1 alpha/beta hydrolase [Alicyclobacillus sacchari]
MFSEFSIGSDDSTQIYGCTWSPEDRSAPRAVVQIAHGMAEHIARYDAFAQFLVSQGIVVYGHDHRGHGRTGTQHGILGYFADHDGFEKVVRDIEVVTKRIEEDYPGVPIFLFGHSMGSSLSLRYIQQFGERLAGVILCGSGWFSRPILMLASWLAVREVAKRGRREPSPFLHRLTFGGFNKAFRPNRTEMDWLSRDTTQVDAYLADPLCGHVHTAGFFHDYFCGLQIVEQPKQMVQVPESLPFLLISGTRDPVGNFGRGVQKLRAALQRAGVLNIDYKLYTDARHELLNEIGREQVYTDIYRWIERRLQR